MRFIICSLFSVLFIGAGLFAADPKKTSAVEIGRHNVDLLPKGKEADGIVGDFVLRNDKIHALISGGQPLRRANMRTENAFVTQGCLYDFDFIGENNDQITAFRPGNAGGEVSWVKVVDTADDVALIESVKTAAKGDGLYTRHEYRVEPGWQHLLITSTYRNESSKPITIIPAAEWRGFENSRHWAAGDVHVADATDPFDKRAYAWAFLPSDKPSAKDLAIAPGEEKKIRVLLAVAGSPLEAYGVVHHLLGKTGTVSGRVLGVDGSDAVRSALQVTTEGAELPLYPNRNGEFRTYLPAGNYTLKFQDLGRESVDKPITVLAGKEVRQEFNVGAAARVNVQIQDEQGMPSPGKVQFIGVDGTQTPVLGTPLRARGTDNQYHSHDGKFTQQLSVGRYLVRVSRGPEFEIEERTIDIAKGKATDVSVKLRRVVDTKGWVSADFHSHSTMSGDNYLATDDRIINLAAEHIEFAPSTEHNRFYAWQPHIERLGLTRHLKTVIGVEFTSDDTHMNGFPFVPDPSVQDFGAPVYDPDVRISAMRLRGWVTPTLQPGGSRYDTYQNSRAKIRPEDPAERWVQINHPSVGAMFFDRKIKGIRPDLETVFDAAEVWSTEILNLNPVIETRNGMTTQPMPNRTFGWLQMLNQGRSLWSVAVSDSHSVGRNGAGAWRMYLPSSNDNPENIDYREIVRNAKTGQMVLTNGPFLTVETEDGKRTGSTITGRKDVGLKVRIQTPSWMEVNRVQVLVNGRQPSEYNFTEKTHPKMFRTGGVLRFDETIRINTASDAHIIVVAVGEGKNLSKMWGRGQQGQMTPMAYTNPIFVDVDGNGFQGNMDTLGFPLMKSSRKGDD